MERRPVLLFSIFYILGIIVQYNINLSENLLFFSILFCLGAFMLIIILKNKYLFISITCIMFFLGAINYQNHYEEDGQLKSYLQSEVTVLGYVSEASFHNNLQLTINMDEIMANGVRYPVKERIITSLRGEYYPPEEFLGKRVEVSGILEEPEPNRNPKLFNYKLYLKSQKINSMLYGSIDQLKFLESQNSIPKLVGQLRHKIITNSYKIMSEKESGILLGILFGQKDYVDDEVNQSFQEVGVAHILAVSGLNVGIVYLFMNRLLKGITLHFRTIIIVLALFVHMMITGNTPSVARATFMILMYILSQFFDRKYDSISAIFFAALIMLIVNPIQLMMTGFQLSFLAVLSIALLYKPILSKMKYIPEYWAELIAVTIAAQIGILPITVYYFNIISPWAPLVNLPIVIILGYLVPVGMLVILISFFSIGVAGFLGYFLQIGVVLMTKIAEFAGYLPFSVLKMVSPSAFTTAVFYLVIILSLLSKQYFVKAKYSKRNYIFALLAIYIIVQMGRSIIPDKMELTFLDVGQGDCSIIRTPGGQTVLIDGGGNREGGFDVGEKILVPYLLKNGIRKIDLIFISHFHKDHMGGLISVLENMKTETLIIGEQPERTEEYDLILSKCKEKNVKVQVMSVGETVILEKDMSFKVLHPSDSLITNSRDDINNNSLVVLMEYKNMRTLFTGDIEAEAESHIVQNYPDLKVDILKIPHHGSKNSSSQELLDLLEPRIAVIQVGRNNFGHPDETVLEKLENRNISLYRNDLNGAIIITISGEKVITRTTLNLEDDS